MSTISLNCTSLLITDDSNKTITGQWAFDRTEGGILIPPSGSTFPTSPVAAEYFWKTDVNVLYRRNDANTAWDALNGMGGFQIIAGDGLTGGGQGRP